jgi:hypothetical protein
VKSCDAPYLGEGSFRTDPADLVLLVLHEPFLLECECLESELFLFSPPNQASIISRREKKCTGTDNSEKFDSFSMSFVSCAVLERFGTLFSSCGLRDRSLFLLLPLFGSLRAVLVGEFCSPAQTSA